jgi:hypothetical protein
MRSKWLVLDDSDADVVVPASDIKPHGHWNGTDTELDLAGADCPCKPQIITGDARGMYTKPTIIHNSFEDAEFVDHAMAALFPSRLKKKNE